MATVEPATACEWTRAAGAPADCRGRLLRGYLHKTSNSLCGIKGYASLIARGSLETARPEAWARKIIAEVEKLETIYRSIQEMVSPQQAESGADPLDGSVRRALALAAGRHANLRVVPPGGSGGHLVLPRRDLELILGEVLANSAQSRTGIVTVRVAVENAADGRSYISLGDDGPGMAAELLMQAADPFVTTREGRIGIGLTRVDTIMDMYGLGWGLRSAPDAGTEVTLEIGRHDDGSVVPV